MSALPADLHDQAGHAVCARHPDQAAIACCTRCGTFICDQCSSGRADQKALCTNCGAIVPPLASRGARFVANLVDQLVWVVPFIPMLIFAAKNPGTFFEAVVALVWLVASLPGVIGLQLFFALRGQSIGKKLMKIRVVRTNGSPASLARILFLRNGAPILANFLCGVFGVVDAALIFGAEQQCVHDHIADTIVVEA